MKKNILAVILACSMVISAGACSNANAGTSGTPLPNPTQDVNNTNTPAAENTPLPTEPLPTGTPVPSAPPEKIVISEVMATNKTYPINGVLCDWIELYNAGQDPLDLSNFYLSDKEKKPLKSQLPKKELAPGEYVVLTCEGEITLPGAKEATKIPGNLSFKLSSEGETVFLTRADGLLIDSISYENLDSNSTITKDGVCDFPSPGYPNTPEGNAHALANVNAYAIIASSPLIINEILSSNNKYKKYTNSKKVSDYYDMVELYNTSDQPILLSDYYLSDGSKHLLDYRLPDVSLAPGEYMLIYCMGRAATIYDNPTDLFKVPESPIELSYFGETVYLTSKDGIIIDCVTFPEMYDGVSYGRSPKDPGQFVIQKTPTLGNKNSDGESTFSTKPVANVQSGAYKDQISVEFTSGGKIYYTTDCSAPTTSSKLWDGKPLVFSKTTTLRAVCYEDNKPASFETVYNYFINDLDVTLDVVSMTMSADDWKALKAQKSKRPLHAINIALYKNNRTEDTLILTEEFSVNAAVELCGASTLYSDKTSYQIKMKSSYGPSKLNYKLFDDLDIDEFNSFTLRGGSQDNAYTTMRDELFSSLLSSYYGEELILREAYRPVNLYVNNEYRGVYYIREHQDVNMIASHYGVDPEDVAFSKSMSTSNIKGGDADDKATLTKAMDLIKNGDLSDSKVFDELLELIDYDSLLTYWAMELWGSDNDCHLRVYRIGDGKWMFALHDQDLTMRETCNYTYKDKFFNQSRTSTYRVLLSALMKSPEFKKDLFATIGKYTKTAFSDQYSSTYAQEKFVNVIAHDMKFNCERWGGTYLYIKRGNSGAKISTYSSWETKYKYLIKMLSSHTAQTIQALKDFAGMTDEEEQLYFK